MPNDPISTATDVPYRGRYRIAKVPPCLITRNDLRKLFKELDARTSEALEKHIASLQRPPAVEEQAWNQTLRNLRQTGRLTITVQGTNGEQIVARSVEALSDDELPDRIVFMRFDSAAALQFMNINPLDRFYVHLDFTEPPTFASYNPWSQPTPNVSQFEVIGSDETWVTGVYAWITDFFRNRRRRRAWLHTQRSFNVAHWVIGFPAALWVVYRLSYYAPALTRLHPALLGAIYAYVFLFSLLIFRGIVWFIPLAFSCGRACGLAIQTGATWAKRCFELLVTSPALRRLEGDFAAGNVIETHEQAGEFKVVSFYSHQVAVPVKTHFRESAFIE
jgi:hypothetical protein